MEVMEGSEVALTVMAVEGALDRTVLLSLALDPSGQLAVRTCKLFVLPVRLPLSGVRYMYSVCVHELTQ